MSTDARILSAAALSEIRERAATSTMFCGTPVPALLAHIDALAAVLRDCAEDLAIELRERYGPLPVHPALQRKYERDMEPVRNAAALLDGVPAPEGTTRT